MCFFEFEQLRQKLWAFFSYFGSFYDARSLNMVMSRDPRCKFHLFIFCPNSTFNFRKSHKISSGKLSRRTHAPPVVPESANSLGQPVLD